MYIALCSIKVYSYVVVNYHGWHFNGINEPLMCVCTYVNHYYPYKGMTQATNQANKQEDRFHC